MCREETAHSLTHHLYDLRTTGRDSSCWSIWSTPPTWRLSSNTQDGLMTDSPSLFVLPDGAAVFPWSEDSKQTTVVCLPCLSVPWILPRWSPGLTQQTLTLLSAGLLLPAPDRSSVDLVELYRQPLYLIPKGIVPILGSCSNYPKTVGDPCLRIFPSKLFEFFLRSACLGPQWSPTLATFFHGIRGNLAECGCQCTTRTT